VPQVSIVGSGPIGASIAHRLAERGRTHSVLLIDAAGQVAAGKALDIRQSGPVQRFDTTIEAATDPLAAAASPVVVLADESAAGPWDGERGLTLVQQLLRAGSRATFVFACPSQVWLMEASYREARVPADRLIGTAPSATVSAVRAVTGLELGLSSVDLLVAGRPPKLVVAWSAATVAGSPLGESLPAHRMLAISGALGRLWPPGPFAIASATAPIVEALLTGSRRRHHALAIVDGELDAKGAAVLLPLELGRGKVLKYAIPALSSQERTELMTGIGRT
jgi:malate dehydrogenase